MGLYQKICERLVNSQNTQIDTIGLLAKAENFLQKTSPSKVEVVEESNMNDCFFGRLFNVWLCTNYGCRIKGKGA